MNDVRPWTYGALFGALWGSAELTLGTALKLSRLPVTGLVMGLVGIVCLVTLRRLQPRPGVCLIAGAVTVLLKVFALGAMVLGPVAGIIRQALIMELALTLGRSRRAGAVAGSAVVLALNPLQAVVTTFIIGGPEVLTAGIHAARDLLGILLPGLGAVELVAAVVLLHAALGALGGWWAWRVAGRVLERLGRVS